MRIGVLSDTHLRPGRALPAIVWELLDGVELILHAGDLVSAGVLSDLEALAPVRAVRGNCDDWELGQLPMRDIVGVGDVRIGLIHGNLGVGPTPERAWQAFHKEHLDVVVFGHSHVPYLEWRNGTLLFNPGSPTDRRRQAFYSLGILELDGKNISARHYHF